MRTSCQAGERKAGEKLKPETLKAEMGPAFAWLRRGEERRTEGDLPRFCGQRVVSFLCPNADDLGPNMVLN